MSTAIQLIGLGVRSQRVQQSSHKQQHHARQHWSKVVFLTKLECAGLLESPEDAPMYFNRSNTKFQILTGKKARTKQTNFH